MASATAEKPRSQHAAMIAVAMNARFTICSTLPRLRRPFQYSDGVGRGQGEGDGWEVVAISLNGLRIFHILW